MCEQSFAWKVLGISMFVARPESQTLLHATQVHGDLSDPAAVLTHPRRSRKKRTAGLVDPAGMMTPGANMRFAILELPSRLPILGLWWSLNPRSTRLL